MRIEDIFSIPDAGDIIARLKRPAGPVDVVLDTDTYNEIDDQFALAYLVRSDDRLSVSAITAVPFYRHPSQGVERSRDPADGMEKSYHEIIKVLHLLGRDDLAGSVYRGATRYLADESTPVVSDASLRIVELAREHDKDHPLYVVAIGAGTNVASALLTDPSINERMVVVWLTGHAYHIGNCSDFNMSQDIAAARVIFGSGVSLVQVPCLGVGSEFRFTKPELEYWFRGKNELCDYLIDNTYEFAKLRFDYEGWSKPLYDPIMITFLLEGDFFLDRIMPSPIPQYDYKYSFDGSRHPMKYIYYVKKDAVIADMARRLSR